jgi:hypothetical protein
VRKLVSILLLLFILASLGESKIIVTGIMSNLTAVFKEDYENCENNKLRKDDPRVKKMQESLEGDTKITFNKINFKEPLLNTIVVDLHVIPVEKISKHCRSVEFLRNHKRYRYLSAVWNQNRDLFDWSNNEDWPYTVDGENYAMELAGTFENRNVLKEKKKIDEDEAREFLRIMIERSCSTNEKEKNKAEAELNELYHSANSFGKLVKNIKKNGFNLIYPVVLTDDGQTADGSHRLITTQFLMDKGLLPEGSFFCFVKEHKKKSITAPLPEEITKDL